MGIPTASSLPSNYFSPNLPNLDAISRAKSREDAASIWDKIVDWFCSTNRVEAKQCLYDLLSPTTTDVLKIESFKRLASLAEPGFTGNFPIYVTSDAVGCALVLSGSEVYFSLEQKRYTCDETAIVKELEACKSAANMPDQAGADDRQVALTRGGDLLDVRPKHQLNELDQMLAGLQCSEEEKKAVSAICNTTTFSLITKHVNKPPTAAGEFVPPICPEELGKIIEYKVTRDEESGCIEVRGRCMQDIAASDDEERTWDWISQMAESSGTNLQKSSDISFDIKISAAGELQLMDLDYCCNADVPPLFGKSRPQ